MRGYASDTTNSLESGCKRYSRMCVHTRRSIFDSKVAELSVLAMTGEVGGRLFTARRARDVASLLDPRCVWCDVFLLLVLLL
jgi:hypothetical protein